MRDARGEPIRNPAPPRCEETPCWDRAAGRKRERFDAAELAVAQRWRACRAFHCLPLPGALADQNPWELRMMLYLESKERTREQRQLMMGIAAGVAAVFGR